VSLFLAVDLGATSGRVSAGVLAPDRIDVHEVHRFANSPLHRDGAWFWDVERLWEDTLAGLAAGVRFARDTGRRPAGIGVDSWGVDVAAVGPDGGQVLPLRSYRSASAAARESVLRRMPAADLFRRSGVAPMAINTIFQLAELLPRAELPAGSTLLLTPDLWTFRLGGDRAAERTIASTTGLLSASTGEWDAGLLDAGGIDARLLPPLAEPGSPAGRTDAGLRGVLGAEDDLAVLRVGAHDTASAVAALPLTESEAFVSCGTWALAGVEHDRPVLTDAAHAAGFTNEAGVGGRTLVMRNLTGLWLLEQCLRGWGPSAALPALLAEAGAEGGPEAFIDVADPDLVGSPDVPGHIRRRCRATGQPDPSGPAALVRCILVSLALAYRRTIREAAALTGRRVTAVRLVGGGCRNELLCRLTAEACGVPVLAGPAEATTLGNIGVQAIACGLLRSPAELRRLVAAAAPATCHPPGSTGVPWEVGDALLDAG
jgi:rhamnulokinase